MPKQTDVVGTIRIPEEDYGRFWNFMKTIPQSEFTPIMSAKAPAKRTHGKTTEGSTGKCLVLNALEKSPLNARGCTAVMVNAGKSPKSVPNVLFELKKDKLIRLGADQNYVITAAGKTFISQNCKGE